MSRPEDPPPTPRPPLGRRLPLPAPLPLPSRHAAPPRRAPHLFTGFGLHPSPPAAPPPALVAELVEALAAPVAALAAELVAALVPPVAGGGGEVVDGEPDRLVEALGRLGLPRPPRAGREQDDALSHADVEALAVALRPTLAGAAPGVPPVLGSRLAHPRRSGLFAMVGSWAPHGGGPVAVENAVSHVRSLAPELPALVTALVTGLAAHPRGGRAEHPTPDLPGPAPSPPGRSDPAAEEARIVRAHGRAHLAPAVAVGLLAVRAVAEPLIDDEPAAAVALGVEAALRVLPHRPMPAAHVAAARARVVAEYTLPRFGYGEVPARGHSFTFAEGPVPSPTGEPADGIVQVVPGGLVVRTGTGDGTVRVGVSALDGPPDEQHRSAHMPWEEIVEVSYEPVAGGATVVGLSGPVAGPREITPPWPGPMRARVHAHGRDDGVDGEPRRESYEIVTWPAPAAPAITLRAGDRLGHRLRGEPEPPVPHRPWRALGWVSDSRIQVAATVTVVVGADPRTVISTLGGDPDSPEPFEAFWHEWAPWVVALPIPAGTLVIEDNGFACSREEALGPLSALGGRAASMFWNVNALTRLSLARDGEVLTAFEVMGDPPAQTDPEVRAALDGLDLAGLHDTNAKGLLAVGRFTGHLLTPGDVEAFGAAGVGHRVHRGH